MQATGRMSGWCIVLVLGLQAGCAGLPPVPPASYPTPILPVPPLEPDAPAAPAPTTPSPPVPFEGKAELPVEALVEAVLARNPTLAQMVAAWQAASARYPQVTSLDDPMFGTTVGPASIGHRDVAFAYRLEVSPRYPLPGKLRRRGANAVAGAGASGSEVDAMRTQITD